MSVIEINSINYKPNIIIFENYIVTFKDQFIYLYNMEGKLLFNDFIKSEANIDDLCIINNNYLIGYAKYVFFKVIINNKDFEIENNILESSFNEIFDVFYSKTNKLLIISYINNIEIRDINDLNKSPIQIINQKESFLLNIKKDLFITFNIQFISLYKKINNIKLYQLSLIKSLPLNIFGTYFRRVLKLDNKTIMVANDNILYLINIKTMKILQNFYLTDYPGEIVFIYKIEDNIYICKENFLILFKYVENQLLFSIFENNSNNLLIFNYLNNLFLEKQYPKLHKTIIINCIKNEISRCGCGKSTLINIILKMETSPVPYLGPFPFVCLQDEDYRPKIKNKYEKK